MKSVKRIIFRSLILLVVIFLSILLGYHLGGLSQPTDGQRLHLSVTDVDGAYHSYSAEDLGNNFDGNLVYMVEDVSITLDKETIPLIEAITEGRITVEEIIAYARIDAQNRYCKEITETKNGLTKFVYQYYDQFDLGVYYDIYETPDGREHLISNVRIHEYTGGTREGFQFRTTDKNGDDVAIDREDWGLSFEVLEATPTYVDFQVTQSGGQQFGELQYYVLSFFDDNAKAYLEKPLPSSDDMNVIEAGKASIHRIDWSESHGELPPGKYYLWLRVCDIFDPNAIHPLTRDFYDEQSYCISFEIP